jgi:hypothetical protein
MLMVFDEVVAPAARNFRPDIVLVSAGFDAHWRDPFQQLQFRCAGVLLPCGNVGCRPPCHSMQGDDAG